MSIGASSVLGGESLTLQSKGTWRDFWSTFRKDRLAFAGLVMVGVICLFALLAPAIAHLVGHGPNQVFDDQINSEGLPSGPSASFLFGADQAGRDVFVRTIFAARTSLIVALTAAVCSTVLGTIVGLVAGFYGGTTDVVLARTIDVFLSLPILLFAISISTVVSVTKNGALDGTLKPGIGLVTGLIAVFSWPYLARIVRGQVISLREREFIVAARSLGQTDLRIMAHELLPNIVSPVIVYLTLIIPSNVLFEASLSFFGLGVPESTPSWGQMIADATNNSLFTYAWWMLVFPGAFLLITMIGFNLIGEGLRDTLDRLTGSGQTAG